MTVLSLLLMWSCVCPAAAQEPATYKVSGTVGTTTENEMLTGASVRLVDSRQPDKVFGMATDARGAFAIDVPAGVYGLEISYIGFATYTATVSVDNAVNLPLIMLDEDSKMVGEVVITARTVTYNANGYIAEISKNPRYRTKSMTDILKLTPGTFSTFDGIKAYGKSVSKVYLNGRELKLTGRELHEYLQNIEGRNVKSMEVVIASGVDEDAASAGMSVLKIVTINPETGGMLGAYATFSERKYSSLYMVGINFQQRFSDKWGIYSNISTTYNNTVDGTFSETHFLETDNRMTNDLLNDRTSKPFNVRFGVSYDLNKDNLFSVEGHYGDLGSESKITNLQQQWEGTSFSRLSDGTSFLNHGFNINELSLLYTRKFGTKAQLDFKANRYELRSDDNDNQLYDYASGKQLRYVDLNSEDAVSYTLQTDFVKRFSALQGRLSAGAKAVWMDGDYDSDYAFYLNNVKDDVSSYVDDYHYNEKLFALYGKYDFTLKKFNITLGLRMEHSVLSPRSAINPELNVKSDYTEFFPEVGITYVLNKEKGHNMSFNYNRGVKRPTVFTLNPLVCRVNEFTYRAGNPHLKPFYTNNYSFVTHWFHKYILRISHRRSKDTHVSDSESRDGIIYNTWYNGAKSYEWSAYAEARFSMGKVGDLVLNARYNYSEDSYKTYSYKGGYWSVGGTAMLNLPGNIDFMLSGNYTPPYETMFSKNTWPVFMSAMASKSFFKNSLTVTLMAGDWFGHTLGSDIEYFYDTYYQKSRVTTRNFMYSLSLRYNIRWGQKSAVRRTSVTSGGAERFN